MNPFAEGKEAFEAGKGVGSNPYSYKRDSESWLKWCAGWKEAYWQANDSSQGGE